MLIQTDVKLGLYAALSPNACAKVSFGKAHEPKVSSLHIPLELVDANGVSLSCLVIQS